MSLLGSLASFSLRLLLSVWSVHVVRRLWVCVCVPKVDLIDCTLGVYDGLGVRACVCVFGRVNSHWMFNECFVSQA